MRSLIIHPTEIAQWHALLHEAQQQCAVSLKESLECYLVFLLMRFAQQPSLASSVLGLDFLSACQSISEHARQRQLKEVGDKCLLFAGLFPHRAKKRRVSISYFVKVGKIAYSTLSNYSLTEELLFTELCVEFTNLMDVLQSIRDDTSAIELIESLELWHETGSKAAWRRWSAHRSSLPIFSNRKNH